MFLRVVLDIEELLKEEPFKEKVEILLSSNKALFTLEFIICKLLKLQFVKSAPTSEQLSKATFLKEDFGCVFKVIVKLWVALQWESEPVGGVWTWNSLSCAKSHPN